MSNRNQVNVLYIAGIGHSGSTLLGMKRGAKETNFFIGEAKRFDIAYSKHDCTCGKSLSDCKYWSNLNMANWHKMLERAKDVKSDNVDTLIDSSKDISLLRKRVQNPNLDTSVVHIIRNPFNHLHRYGLKAFLSWFITHPITYLYSKFRDLDYDIVTYEELLDSNKEWDRRIRDEEYHIFCGNIPAVETFETIG